MGNFNKTEFACFSEQKKVSKQLAAYCTFRRITYLPQQLAHNNRSTLNINGAPQTVMFLITAKHRNYVKVMKLMEDVRMRTFQQ